MGYHRLTQPVEGRLLSFVTSGYTEKKTAADKAPAEKSAWLIPRFWYHTAMAPKLSLPLCLMFFLAEQSARARLGDTAEQCKERYGKPQPIKFEPPAEKKHIYRKDGATITAELMGGKVGFISYRKAKNKAFTPEEIGARLEENGGGKPWGKPMEIQSGRGKALRWKREDRSAQLMDGGRLLIFQSSSYANKRAEVFRARAAEREKNAKLPSDKEPDPKHEHERRN